MAIQPFGSPIPFDSYFMLYLFIFFLLLHTQAATNGWFAINSIAQVGKKLFIDIYLHKPIKGDALKIHNLMSNE